MSRIVQRTRRDLREIAHNAPISPDARSSILARVGVPVARDDEEVVMLEKNTYTYQHRRWAIPLALAATIALGVAGIVLINSRSDETTDVSTADSTLPSADPAVADVSPTLLARAEEFDAAMAEQGLTGLVLDSPTDVTDVYEFGDADPPDWRAVEWPFEAGPVDARLVLHESLTDADLSGDRLIVDTGRGTTAGDAWIDAVVQTMVRLREPDLPENQIADLAADLTSADGVYYEEVWSSVFVSLVEDAGITVDAGSAHDFTESGREAPLADDVSPTLLARAEEFDALMREQGLTGLVFDDPVDVTYVYDFGYAPEPGEPREYRAVEWAFEAGQVEARLALHEHLDDDRIVGERLTVTDGRGTPEGDAWIEAVIQTMVRWHEPDLPESQVVDLAADLAAETGMYYEAVWSTFFVAGQPDSGTFVVETGWNPDFVESDRADPDADVTVQMDPIVVDPENPFYREPFKKIQAEEFTALLEAEGLLGVDADARTIVPSTTAQVFEWTLLDEAVEGRLQVSEIGVTEWYGREGWSATLLVDQGRGTAEGDAYIAAAVGAIVQLHQPDLADGATAELVADLTDGDHSEQVGSTTFTSTLTDAGIEVVATTMTE